MSKSLNPLSVRNDRPVDPWTVEILRDIDGTLEELKCRYMLMGATARDLLLFHVFGRAAMRATQDVDFAIAVESWEKFADVVRGILSRPKFQPSKIEHRVFFKPSEAPERVPVDIVPFGGVASEENKIFWPGDSHMVMSVAGLDDAMTAAVWVSVKRDLLVPIASLPGLTVLKLFAWADRRANKDATDLHRILKNYADADNEDRLYGDRLDILEKAGFDMELAGSHLLASDAVELCSETTLQNLRGLFSLPDTVEDLENQMTDRGFWAEEAANRTVPLLQAFFTTLFER